MARDEQDREDLLREATALAVRLELAIEGEAEPVVAGFRGEAASLFFGADPVYHFNAQYELRRAYAEGELFKAERGRLIRLRRHRTPQQVVLLSRELSEAETQAFLDKVAQRVARVRAAVESGRYRLRGAVPSAENAMCRFWQWLSGWPEHPHVAETPYVGG
jgi:hypothetical protein